MGVFTEVEVEDTAFGVRSECGGRRRRKHEEISKVRRDARCVLSE